MTLEKEDTPSPQSNEPSLAVKLVLHLTAYIPRPSSSRPISFFLFKVQCLPQVLAGVVSPLHPHPVWR